MIDDIYFFESKYFKNNSDNFKDFNRLKNIEDFYSFSKNEKSVKIIENYIQVLYDNSNKTGYAKKINKYLNLSKFNINFLEFKYFKNENHFLCAFISIFIFRALSSNSKLNQTHESLLLKKERSFTNSDDIINKISTDLHKFSL
jgi:hypothetical protein